MKYFLLFVACIFLMTSPIANATGQSFKCVNEYYETRLERAFHSTIDYYGWKYIDEKDRDSSTVDGKCLKLSLSGWWCSKAVDNDGDPMDCDYYNLGKVIQTP